MPKTEYQFVVVPSDVARDAGIRIGYYPKPSYEKAVKAFMDFHEQRDAGRFEKTWTQNATVYIETREVPKWTKLEMPDVDANSGSTTSRPGS